MDITAVNNAAQVLAATAPAPVVNVEGNQEIIQAVRALNAAELFGQENELTFVRDRQSQRLVMRLVNRRTHEVVDQVPAEYVLRMAEALRGAEK